MIILLFKKKKKKKTSKSKLCEQYVRNLEDK